MRTKINFTLSNSRTRNEVRMRAVNKFSQEAQIFSHGYSSELILKVVKWFFIEQDIRYWNYSGRGILMSAIPIPLGD